jgi:hypothetical protein
MVMELDDLLAIHANEMSVARGIGEVRVILGGLLPQAHLSDQAGPNEEGEGAVDRGAGDFVVAAATAGKKRLGGEVLLGAKNHFGDEPAL